MGKVKYRIVKDTNHIYELYIYVIEKKVFGLWWSRSYLMDFKGHHYFFTEEKARKVVDLLNSGKVSITKEVLE